jgi:hypothetical protein
MTGWRQILAAAFVFAGMADRHHGAAQAEQPEAQSGPPVISLPIEVVEPPRNVVATQWSSPYCGHWDDGCVECTRSAIGNAAQCHNEPNWHGLECRRRKVICFDATDETYFDRICSSAITIIYSKNEDGSITAAGTAWTVNWHLINSKWTSEKKQRLLGELFSLPDIQLPPDPGDDFAVRRKRSSYFPVTGPFAFGAIGVKCERSFGKD